MLQLSQLVYSVVKNDYMGFIIEPYIVALGPDGEWAYGYRGVSSNNVKDVLPDSDDDDVFLIQLAEKMHPLELMKSVVDRDIKSVNQFYDRYFISTDPKVLKSTELSRNIIREQLNQLRSQFIKKIGNKALALFSKEGPPLWHKLYFSQNLIEMTYSFVRHPDGIDYSLELNAGNDIIKLNNGNTFLFNQEPALIIHNNYIYSFLEDVEYKKINPFFIKDVISIPKEREKEYFEHFVLKVLANSKAKIDGFDVIEISEISKVEVHIKELCFENKSNEILSNPKKRKIIPQMEVKLVFYYSDINFVSGLNQNQIRVIYKDSLPFIFKVNRDTQKENFYINFFQQYNIDLTNVLLVDKIKVIDWINNNTKALSQNGIDIVQVLDKDTAPNKYYIGESSIDMSFSENIDWFEVNAFVVFGSFKIPFSKIYQLIKRGKREVVLPNKEVAVIPQKWINDYSSLLHFLVETPQGELVVKKHHYMLVDELQKQQDNNNHQSLSKLESLQDVKNIPDYDMPLNFKGELRTYQKAGYNWLRFLQEYKFGGCLADDMGLGKTIQTLALLQYVKENKHTKVSLLVVPKTLIYNWIYEASCFTPDINILVHTGSSRVKSTESFADYDIVLTSYPILLRDSEMFLSYEFNYLILDEAQHIKNPLSSISKLVYELQSQYRLTLSGTPIENTTIDLWSQMNFINSGLLGSLAYFKLAFLYPIEKQKVEAVALKLKRMISPFILRRMKSQVAKELPEKTINIHYVEMSDSQQDAYDKMKAECKKTIFDMINDQGINRSRFMLLKGLMRLRQIANHPILADSEYDGDSGKLSDIIERLESVITEGNSVLIFSSFVQHLKLIKDYLDKNNIKYAYIDGSTKDRQSQVSYFQQSSDVQVFLSSLKAGGVGLNLTKAEYVFLLDPWWNPASEAQAIDRAYRIGQKNNVIVYKFIVKKTVEEKIMELQNSKMILSDNLISYDDQLVKQLDIDIINNLLV